MTRETIEGPPSEGVTPEARGGAKGTERAKAGWFSTFISRNIEEIGADKALRLYGACLGISYIATAAHYFIRRQYLYLTTPNGSLCWPLFPDCYQYHVLSVPQAIAVGCLLACLAAAFPLYFLMGRVGAGWAFLLATVVLDWTIISQDFRSRLNEHYMLLWTTIAFLFFPKKRQTVRFLILSFYFWAGRIKLNHEWLSGSDLPHRLWLIPVSTYPVACAYVVILEMVFVWALVQPRKWLFWAVFAQFVLFHAMSWSIVHFYYPVLMAGIISIFPLCRLLPNGAGNDLSDFFHLRLPRSLYALLAVFAALQLSPLLYPGDPDWTDQGRLVALHMFTGRSQCRVLATEKFKTGAAKTVDLFRRDLTPNMNCDPLVYFNEAQRICRQLPGQDPDFVDLDLRMDVSKTVSPASRPLIATDDFCAKHIRYNAFLPNDWILPARGDSP